MNMLVRKDDTRMASPLVSQFPFGGSLFGNRFLDSVTEGLSMPSTNLMQRYVEEDGSTVVEYNLAGFEPEDISVKVDTALGELLISARSENGNNRRAFSTVLSLSPYTSAEDITTDYKNGVLAITIAPLEKRKEESLIEIPINRKEAETKKRKEIKE